MARIEIRHDAGADTVMFTLKGAMTLDAIVRAGDGHFGKHNTNRSIWDMRGADLSGIDVDALKEIAIRSRQASTRRTDPRTAHIVDDNGIRALFRLYEAIAVPGGEPIIRAFESLNDALVWLEPPQAPKLEGEPDEVIEA